MTGIMILGIGLVAFSVVELIAAIRVNAARWLMAQAMMFLSLGLAFVIPPLVSDGLVRVGVSGLFGLGVLSSAILQMRLLHKRVPENGRHNRGFAAPRH